MADTKIVVDCSTGEVSEIELTAEEVAQREADAQAAAEAERLQQTVKNSLEAEREVAQRVLRAEIGELAIELASRIVGQKLQEDAVANKVVDDFIAELEGKRA